MSDQTYVLMQEVLWKPLKATIYKLFFFFLREQNQKKKKKKGASFRSLDQIVIHPSCKLRKIFTMKNPICDENDIELSYDKTYDQIPKLQNFPSGIYYVNQFVNFNQLKLYQENQSVQGSLENLNSTVQTELPPAGKTPNKVNQNQKIDLKKQQNNQFQNETLKNTLMTSPNFNKQQIINKNKYEEKKTQTVQGRRNAQQNNQQQQQKQAQSRSKSPYTSLVSPNNTQKPNSKAQKVKPKLALDQQSNFQQSTEMAQTPSLKQQHSALVLKKKQFSDIKQTKNNQQQQDAKTPLQIKNINPWGETNEIQNKKKQFDFKKSKKEEEKKENLKKYDMIKNTKNKKNNKINPNNKNNIKKEDFDETLFQERISKFNTISDPMSLKQQLEGDDEVLYYQNLGEEEIEEQLEIDITNKSHQQVQNQIEDYFNEKEVQLKVDDNVNEINPKELEDSLECDDNKDYRNFEFYEENKIQETEITQNSMLEGNNNNNNQKPNFYEQQFNEIVENDMRPTSPPFLLQTQENKQMGEMVNICGKLQESNVENEFLRKSEMNNLSMISNSSKMLEVVYDPLLNCYYHPQTNTYYEFNA